MFSDGTVIEVVQEIRDPNYSYDSMHYKFVYGVVSSTVGDIGLQKLAKPVGYSPGRQVLGLLGNIPYALQINPGMTGTVLGWGATQQTQVYLPPPSTFSPSLQQINEVVEPNSYCQSVMDGFAEFISGGILTQSPFQLDSTLFCAQPVGFIPVYPPLTPSHFEGVCTGDTGPLFTEVFGMPVVLGFVTDQLSTSLETPCGNGFDLYTKFTPALMQWITSVVHGQP